MTDSYMVNTSPVLTFAKLGMNGDTIRVNCSKIKKDNVEQYVFGSGLVVNDDYEALLSVSASGKDIDRLLSPDSRLMTVKGDAEITLSFAGSGVVQRVIRVARGVEATLVEVVKGSAPDAAINSTSYILEDNARLKLIRIQLLDKDTLYIDDLRAKLLADSYLEVVRLDLGSKMSYIASNVSLVGKNAEYIAHGDYLLNGSQRLDINMIADHIAPNTKSDMRCDGVLLDSASKIFRGVLDFKSGCKGAKGAENEEVILLSPDVDNQSVPIILCGEEDVEGNHGASVGKISDEIIYYLMTRGFDEDSAIRLIIKSKFRTLTDQLANKELCSVINKMVDGVLS
ncbi:MAG: SufD family Fe-S cluster assembly protein [Saccharofermentans sp.]|nr:SufD family Fe-S cluster assembly protein [Saccharofermentans sp.]